MTEEQVERLYGQLVHPTELVPLSKAPMRYRSVAERLEAAQAKHDSKWTAAWAAREIELTAAGATADGIETALAAERERAAEAWSAAAAKIRRGPGGPLPRHPRRRPQT